MRRETRLKESKENDCEWNSSFVELSCPVSPLFHCPETSDQVCPVREIVPHFIEFSPLVARTFRFFDLKAADDYFPRGIIVRTGKPVEGGRCDQLLVLRQNVHAVVRARQQQQNAEQSHSKVDPLPRHLQNFIVFCHCVCQRRKKKKEWRLRNAWKIVCGSFISFHIELNLEIRVVKTEKTSSRNEIVISRLRIFMHF